MYGHRARIGYTSPPAATEVFPYEFYMVAPEGVTLALTTMAMDEMNPDQIDRGYQITLRAAKDLARAGVNLVVLGGVPINVSRGIDQADTLLEELEAEIGVPVTTSLNAQMEGMRRLGAERVAVAHPFKLDEDASTKLFADRFAHFGFEYVGSKGANMPFMDFGGSDLATAAGVIRQVVREHPEADAVFVSCPHWAVAKAVGPLERELGVAIVASSLAISWHALRRCGVEDRIDGYGRLLSEF